MLTLVKIALQAYIFSVLGCLHPPDMLSGLKTIPVNKELLCYAHLARTREFRQVIQETHLRHWIPSHNCMQTIPQPSTPTKVSCATQLISYNLLPPFWVLRSLKGQHCWSKPQILMAKFSLDKKISDSVEILQFNFILWMPVWAGMKRLVHKYRLHGSERTVKRMFAFFDFSIFFSKHIILLFSLSGTLSEDNWGHMRSVFVDFLLLHVNKVQYTTSYLRWHPHVHFSGWPSVSWTESGFTITSLHVLYPQPIYSIYNLYTIQNYNLPM